VKWPLHDAPGRLTVPTYPSPEPKSRSSQTTRYTLTRWDGLIHFLDDGRIDLDKNAVERAIRPLTLNLKNALFAGSDEGGDNWAVIATLIENCKHASINPHTWLEAMPFQAPVLKPVSHQQLPFRKRPRFGH
jgi:hypothetical protein